MDVSRKEGGLKVPACVGNCDPGRQGSHNPSRLSLMVGWGWGAAL